MSKLNIEPISQRDNMHSRVKLGTGTGTIGGFGCALVCVGMQCRYHGKEVSILQLNEAAIEKGIFYKENLFDWKSLEKIYPDIKWVGKFDYGDKPADLQLIDNQLEKKQPVIAKVEADELGTPKGDHFILIVGKDGNDYLVNDPWWRPSDKHPQQFLLSQYYSNLGSNKPEHIILGIRLYEGPIEKQDMNEYDKKSLELITFFTEGENTKKQKFGNTESATRALIDTFNRYDSMEQAVKNSEELAKIKIEQALSLQKAQFQGEKQDMISVWQSKLDSANNKNKTLQQNLVFARNIAINSLQVQELFSLFLAKLLNKFTPLPTEKKDETTTKTGGEII